MREPGRISRGQRKGGKRFQARAVRPRLQQPQPPTVPSPTTARGWRWSLRASGAPRSPAGGGQWEGVWIGLVTSDGMNGGAWPVNVGLYEVFTEYTEDHRSIPSIPTIDR